MVALRDIECPADVSRRGGATASRALWRATWLRPARFALKTLPPRASLPMPAAGGPCTRAADRTRTTRQGAKTSGFAAVLPILRVAHRAPRPAAGLAPSGVGNRETSRSETGDNATRRR